MTSLTPTICLRTTGNSQDLSAAPEGANERSGGVGAPRASELGGVQGSPPTKKEAQREMDDLTDADYMFKDDGE